MWRKNNKIIHTTNRYFEKQQSLLNWHEGKKSLVIGKFVLNNDLSSFLLTNDFFLFTHHS